MIVNGFKVYTGSSKIKHLYTSNIDTQKRVFLKTRTTGSTGKFFDENEYYFWTKISHMWNTCFGYFSHSSGNPLTCGSSISFESIFSTVPFSSENEEPEIICLTSVWFKSTWKSAEIFLTSLTSYSATLTKKGSTWRKHQKHNIAVTESKWTNYIF